ncbi:hypothetical protein MC28_1521 [Bacillus thuringiensis MC28]|nr:hypothetical protein MC28_1521 [Bacillus thuringiensis MC28]
MPKKNSKMKNKDPFVMNEDCVNKFVSDFLKSKGFNSVNFLVGREKGIDVKGSKDGKTIYVESKGSHANNHDEDTVFQTKQIKVHTYNQIGKLMEYKNEGDDKLLLAMANPDIPRIRERVNRVANSLDNLGFIRLWVQEDQTIEVEYPLELEGVLYSLGLL